MSPALITEADLAGVLRPGGRTLVLGCAGESLTLARAVMNAGAALGAMTFTGIFIPGVNTRSYLANAQVRIETFFMTPELRAAGGAVQFMPLCYADILDRLRTVPIDAALFMVAPPDAEGYCRFGPTVDFLAELWPRIPVRVAHINPLMPRTHGHRGIPHDRLSAFIEGEQSLISTRDAGTDAAAEAIGRHLAPWIEDGATLQAGLGKVPGAVLRALNGHRNLRMHTGLIVDAVVDLEEAGALAPGAAVTVGSAIGSERLYKAIERPTYRFQPVSVTHDARQIGGIRNFVAINSALEVDLLGQAHAELGPTGLMSGPGGALDFARGARLGGGLRIVALPSTAGKGATSRIVAPGQGQGPVSLGRMDVDLVVTEEGVADLRGLGYPERAGALVAIAAPPHREPLERAWQAYATRL